MRKITIASFVLALGGCAHVDTGQVDYRVAERAPSVAAPVNGRRNCHATSGASCALAPAVVERRYLTDPGAARFTDGDYISIELDQGVIGDEILEGMLFGRQLDNRGEFAILANVFEFDSVSDPGGTQVQRFLDYGFGGNATPDQSDVELKLVYYSDDVEARQPLNQSGVPLLPRTQYRGGSIGIQIVIIEVDAGSAPFGKMLGTLARFGQRALPGVSEESDFIFDMGEALLNGSNGDDRLFEYRFVLSPPGDNNGVPQATLTPGRYVLRRAQNRTTPINWRNVWLDHNTGRLFRGERSNMEEVRDEAYLVLNIRKHDRTARFAGYDQQNWSSFVERLRQMDPTNVNLTQISNTLRTELMTRRSGDQLASLADTWGVVDQKMNRLQSIVAAPPVRGEDLTLCRAQVREFRLQSDIAQRELRLAVRAFNSAYAAAIGGAEPALQEAQEESLISLVAGSFEPYEPSDLRDKFATRDAFRTAWTGTAGTAALETQALTTAQREPGTMPSCDPA